MKHRASLQALAQVLLLGVVELVILVGMVAAISWTTWQDWPAAARAAIFLVGFAVFALPVIVMTQQPYRRPAWMAKTAALGITTPATLEVNPYAGEEWQPKPGDWMVQMQVRLESGEESWMTCPLGDARALAAGEALTVYLDPAYPERCGLVKR